MIEDEILKWRFRQGSKEALCRIYEKYLDYLLTLAVGFVSDFNTAQDIVHDVFVRFAASRRGFGQTGNLKSYLTTCIVNQARDQIRRTGRQPSELNENALAGESDCPDRLVIGDEMSQRLNGALFAGQGGEATAIASVSARARAKWFSVQALLLCLRCYLDFHSSVSLTSCLRVVGCNRHGLSVSDNVDTAVGYAALNE